jgi:hypothetical protein
MPSVLESALQRALSVRLNLQISLSQLPMIEEWMDIHLDRWLEHVPTPPDMPDMQGVSYLAMLGSDLRRVWWGAWGDPRGFVPKMADYFKLCNIAKSDAHVLDQAGEALEPELVGSWIGVWGGKVITGWHFCNASPWDKVEAMFGTHEAKFQLKKWVEDHRVERIERFTQAIGENPYTEIELAVPGTSVDQQVDTLSKAFAHFTGTPLDGGLVERMKHAPLPEFALVLRVRGGKIVRVGAQAPQLPVEEVETLCADMKVGHDAKLPKLVSALGDKIVRVEYGRAGDRAGVDVYLEPGDPPAKPHLGVTPAAKPSEAN